MRTETERTALVVGLARTEEINPITHVYKLLIVSIVAERESGVVTDLELNSVCRLTSSFLRDLLVGYSLYTQLDEMIARVESRYLGESQKAITVALKDACHKLQARQ